MGPLRFLLYTKDTMLSYADNIRRYPERYYVIIRRQYSGNNDSQKWLALNKLSLNTNKTVYIEFGNQVNSTPQNLDINIQGSKIKRVESMKYLGIIFYSNTIWNEHMEYIYNKTKYLIFIFYNLAKLMTTGALRMIYYALFHSIISYGIIAWGRHVF